MPSLVLHEIKAHELRSDRTLIDIAGVRLNGVGIWSILGKNFSGRTALLRAIAGELQYSSTLRTSARISVEAMNQPFPASFAPADDAVYLSASPDGLISGLARTVREEIALHRTLQWRRGAPIVAAKHGQIQKRLRLESVLGQNPHTLSGGQMAAVALAAALELGRPVVCIDGLLGQLDMSVRPAAYELLESYAGHGAYVLVAENDFDSVIPHSVGAVVLEDGHIVECTSAVDAVRSQAAQRAGTQPTALRYASELMGVVTSAALPVTDEDFLNWICEEFDVRSIR